MAHRITALLKTGAALALAATCGVMTLVLYYRHWANIRRLWAGTEPKIGSEKPKSV